DLIVAVLDNDAVNFVATEIENILRLARRFFGAGPVALHEIEVGENTARDDEKDQGRFPLHGNCEFVRPGASTKQRCQERQRRTGSKSGSSNANSATPLRLN